MNIAVMMRPIDQENSGHHHYLKGVLEQLLNFDDDNTYILLYRSPKWYGLFSNYSKSKEILIKSSNKFVYDQIAAPLAAKKERVDIILHTKFSVPLISHCPVAMGLCEPAWYVWPEHYDPIDVIYQKLFLPIYIRKAKQLFPWTQFMADETRKYIKIPQSKITVTYGGINSNFRVIEDTDKLKKTRRKYGLPDKFILSVTRVIHPGYEKSQSFHEGKNVDTTVNAYLKLKDKIPHKLVLAGKKVREYLLSKNFDEKQLKDIVFLGLVSQNDLPCILNLADLFVIPSFYEGFGYALVEAMACGCAIVASQTGSCPEVGDDAVIFADPRSYEDFADKILNILESEKLRAHLKEKSKERARFFSWKNSACRILYGLQKAVTL